jgi:hypothetical protein
LYAKSGKNHGRARPVRNGNAPSNEECTGCNAPPMYHLPPALIATPAVADPNIYENIIIEFVIPRATLGATAEPQHFYPKQKIQKILQSIWATCPNAQIRSSIQHTLGITNMAELPSTPQSLEAFFYVALHVHPIGGLMGASLHFSLVTDESVGIRSLLQTPDIQSFCREENAYNNNRMLIRQSTRTHPS